jgi:hypothetical protein
MLVLFSISCSCWCSTLSSCGLGLTSCSLWGCSVPTPGPHRALVTRTNRSARPGRPGRQLTHHLKCPTYASCKAACRVLNNLSHHPAIGICYSGSQLNLHAYTDSDWGSDKKRTQGGSPQASLWSWLAAS